MTTTCTSTTVGVPAPAPGRRPRRGAGMVGLVVAAAVIGLATPAWAHVDVEGATTAADGVTTVEFVWDHGCDGQPTTSLELQLPEGAVVGAASLPAGWAATGEGRVLRLAGPGIASGTPAGFSLELTGYDTSVEQLVPTVQRCPDGEEAWIGASEDADDAAPRIAATTSAPPATTVTTAPAGTTQDTFAVTSTGDDAATSTHSHVPWGTIVAVTAGVAVVIAAVVLLVVRARRTAS